MKKIKFLLLLFLLLNFIGCVTPKKDTPISLKVKKEGQSWNWKSFNFDFKALIKGNLIFRGDKSIYENDKTLDYSIWSNEEDGSTLILIDWKNNKWKFPDGKDPLAPQHGQNKFLLKYEKFDYAIWKGISKRTYNVLTGLNIKVPKCKVVVNKSYINPDDRSEVVWLIYYKPWSCDYKDFDKILRQLNKDFSVQ
jgi:hypothetical protein